MLFQPCRSPELILWPANEQIILRLGSVRIPIIPLSPPPPTLAEPAFWGVGKASGVQWGWEAPRGGKGCAGRAQLRARSAYRREGVMTGLLWEGIWGGEEEREGGKLRWKEKSRLRKEQKKYLKESWWMKVGGWGKDEVRTNVRGRWRRSWRLDQCLYMWQTGRDQLMLGTFSSFSSYFSFSSAFSPSSLLILLRPLLSLLLLHLLLLIFFRLSSIFVHDFESSKALGWVSTKDGCDCASSNIVTLYGCTFSPVWLLIWEC